MQNTATENLAHYLEKFKDDTEYPQAKVGIYGAPNPNVHGGFLARFDVSSFQTDHQLAETIQQKYGGGIFDIKFSAQMGDHGDYVFLSSVRIVIPPPKESMPMRAGNDPPQHNSADIADLAARLASLVLRVEAIERRLAPE